MIDPNSNNPPSQEIKNLVIEYDLYFIKTEDDNEKALDAVSELAHKKNKTFEEFLLYNLLIEMIEKFENDFYKPGSLSTPESMLSFLMEQKNLKPADLAEVLENKYIVFNIINGNQKINEEQAKKLADFFGVDLSLFMPNS